MPSSRRSFQPKDQTQVSYVSCMLRWSLYHYHQPGSPERWDMDVYSIRILPSLCSKYSTIWRRKSHEQKSLMGYSPWGSKELDSTELLHLHFQMSTGVNLKTPATLAIIRVLACPLKFWTKHWFSSLAMKFLDDLLPVEDYFNRLHLQCRLHLQSIV